MASMESGQARAAYLMDAARRSHFVSRIQKYEAKVRHGKLQRDCMAEQAQRTVLCNRDEAPEAPEAHSAAEKTVTPEKILLGFEERVVPQRQKPEKVQDFCNEKEGIHKQGFVSDKESHRKYGREESPEQRIFSERKEILPGMLQRSTSVSSNQSLRTMMKGFDALGLGNVGFNDVAASDKLFPIEMPVLVPMAAPEMQDRIYVELKPPVISHDVDIAAVASALKIKIKAADMSSVMQEHAFRCARECLDSLGKLHSKRIAHTLKKEFDNIYGPAWHCIVGTSFGSYVTHSLGGFVYFSLEKVSVLLFKTTVEPIEN